MRRFPVLFLLLFLFVANSKAQFYVYGQDDGKLHWSFFDTQHYRLIYPGGIDSVAFKVADRLEYFYPFQAEEMQHKHSKTPVILHNETGFSNGLVSWAPKRLEVFTNPDPNGYPQDWLTQLVIHEGRHVFQVDKLDQGLTRVLSWFLGEQVVGAAVGYLPEWFLEGDAVDAETRFSYSGRGRLPSFEMENRAILLSREEPYSYSKAVLGSYRSYVPDHYQTGYLIVDYGRRTYGNGLWNDMIDFAGQNPYSVDPAHFAFKKYGVKNKRYLYYEAMMNYSDLWRKQDRQIKPDFVSVWTHRNRSAYTQYKFPHFISENEIIVLREGLDQIPEFVMISSGGYENVIFKPGYLNTGSISYSSGKVTWDEFVPDLRWSNLNYSSVRILDLYTGEARTFGSKTRWYSPSLSKDGTQIAAVEHNVDYTISLILIDVQSGMYTSYPTPGGRFIQQPCWTEQDSAIVLTLTDKEEEFLYSFNPKTREWTELYCNGHDDISWPVVRGNKIYFSSTNSGIDNIYRFDLVSRTAEKITESKFGATQPQLSPRGDRLIYADYTAEGFEPVFQELGALHPLAVNDIEQTPLVKDRAPAEKEKEIIDNVEEIVPGEYRPKKFSKTGHLVNIHSWLPLYVNYLDPLATSSPEALPVTPGLTLVSQNLLSTAITTLGYQYSNGYHYLHTGAVLKGRYPVFEVGMHYGGLPDIAVFDSVPSPELSPDNLLFNIDSYVPLRFNTGKFVTFLQPGISWDYRSRYYYYDNISGYRKGMHYLTYSTYFAFYLRKGLRDIVPRYGLVVNLRHLTTPFENVQLGTNTMGMLTAYLPGILPHHAVKGSIGYQYQSPKKYIYGNLFAPPRGIDMIYAGGLCRLSGDYIFPIAYPDLSLGFVGYITRVRGAVWVDFMKGKDVYISDFSENHLDSQKILTTGADLLIDWHPLRFSIPVSIGARVEYIRESGKFRAEMLYSIDLP